MKDMKPATGPDPVHMSQEQWSDFAEGVAHQPSSEIEALRARVAELEAQLEHFGELALKHREELEQERDQALAEKAKAVDALKLIYKREGLVYLHDLLTSIGVPEAEIDYWRDPDELADKGGGDADG